MLFGNGWPDAGLQTKSYPDYALMMNLISQAQHDSLDEPVSICLQDIEDYCDGSGGDFTDCNGANDDCNQVFNDVMGLLQEDLNFYDIRKKCKGSLCYDFSGVESFLNQTSVKTALGVDEGTPFVSCSKSVSTAMSGDQMRNLSGYIPALLEDRIKLLVYAGEYDLICKWLGNLLWVNDTQWKGRGDFLRARNVTFNVDGSEAGWWKSSGALTFLKVKDSGHMVPMDQPKATLEMLRRWMKGGSLHA